MNNNILNLNDFKNLNKNTKLQSDKLNELVDIVDGTYQVYTNIDIPQQLINAFVKKVKDESGKDIRQTKGDSMIAEMLASYIKTSFTNIENLPSSIVLGSNFKKDVQVEAQPEVQVQVQNTAQEVPAQEVQTTQTQVVQPTQPAQPAQTQVVQTQEI